jgi:hypothetical protein
VDEQLGRLRGQMPEDAALVSRATEWEAMSNEAPVCLSTRLTTRSYAIIQLNY